MQLEPPFEQLPRAPERSPSGSPWRSVPGAGRRRRGARTKLNWREGPVAQLVEQWTFNPWVAGSSPAGPTGECCCPPTLGQKGSMGTITDVARIAGVSIATVSHVVNGTKNVSPVTRQRVESPIATFQYVPNVGAQSLRNGRTRSIGLVASDITQYFFGQLIAEVERLARDNGQTVLVANSGEDADRERRVVQDLLNRRTDGLIIAPVASSDGRVIELCTTASCPVVLVDRIREPSHDQIGIDNRSAMAALTQHLLACGHRRIALLAGDTSVWTLRERIAGFTAMMERAQIPPAEYTIVHTPAGLHDGEAEMSTLLRSANRPTAVIAASATLTVGAMHAFAKARLRFPVDVAFASFDGALNSEFFEASLTSVIQPVSTIGAEAVRLLLQRVKRPDVAPVTLTQKAVLQHGVSCGCGGRI